MIVRSITGVWLRAEILTLIGFGHSNAANSIVVGDVVADPPTICCLGFSVPIVSGDDDYDAVATIEYRRIDFDGTEQCDWSGTTWRCNRSRAW